MKGKLAEMNEKTHMKNKEYLTDELVRDVVLGIKVEKVLIRALIAVLVEGLILLAVELWTQSTNSNIIILLFVIADIIIFMMTIDKYMDYTKNELNYSIVYARRNEDSKGKIVYSNKATLEKPKHTILGYADTINEKENTKENKYDFLIYEKAGDNSKLVGAIDSDTVIFKEKALMNDDVTDSIKRRSSLY